MKTGPITEFSYRSIITRCLSWPRVCRMSFLNLHWQCHLFFNKLPTFFFSFIIVGLHFTSCFWQKCGKLVIVSICPYWLAREQTGNKTHLWRTRELCVVGCLAGVMISTEGAMFAGSTNSIVVFSPFYFFRRSYSIYLLPLAFIACRVSGQHLQGSLVAFLHFAFACYLFPR